MSSDNLPTDNSLIPNMSSEIHALQQAQVVIYPTEAVWGIGCDPKSEVAVQNLLEIKQRPVEKGLILIANDYGQLLPYVADDKIPMDKRSEIFSSWPGPVTFLMPAAKNAPAWITGGSELIACRVTAHPTVKRMCKEFGGAIVSTSANLTGEPTPESIKELQQLFGDKVGAYVDEPLGGNKTPSKIINALTGEVLRS